MRKIVIAALSTVSVLVLVFTFDASRRGDDVTTAAGPSGSSGSSGSSDGSAQTGDSSHGSSGTFTGSETQTQWGIVQVQIVVKNGKITEATALQYPQNNHHDIEINRWAIPQLEQGTVDNNGEVDSYSGATVTCDGYRQSLQSALDQANL